MPNWCENRLKVSFKHKKDLLQFLNDGLQGGKHEPQKTLEACRDFIDDNRDAITMRSWLPLPATFHRYDTTNIHSEKLKVGEDIYDHIHNKYIKVTEEVVAEYRAAENYQKKRFGVVGWYDYNVKTLGTKWDASLTGCGVTIDGSTAMFYFDTAWSTPDEWLYAMQERYPDAKFEMLYREDGCCFKGAFYSGGDGELYHVNEDDLDQFFPDEMEGEGFFAPYDYEEDEEDEED